MITEQKDKHKGKIFSSWNKNSGLEISSMTGRLLWIKFHENYQSFSQVKVPLDLNDQNIVLWITIWKIIWTANLKTKENSLRKVIYQGHYHIYFKAAKSFLPGYIGNIPHQKNTPSLVQNTFFTWLPAQPVFLLFF